MRINLQKLNTIYKQTKALPAAKMPTDLNKYLKTPQQIDAQIKAEVKNSILGQRLDRLAEDLSSIQKAKIQPTFHEIKKPNIFKRILAKILG